MHFECTRCGGDLDVEAGDYLVECPFCGAAVAIDGAGEAGREGGAGREAGLAPDLPRTPSPGGGAVAKWLPLLVIAAVLVTTGVGLLVFFLLQPQEGGAPRSAAAPVAAAPEPISTPISQPGSQPKPGPRSKPRSRPKPSYDDPPGPVLRRSEAKKVLAPEILACMKAHRVHYLITRIGQGYDAPSGLYPPLTLVHGSVVDYRDVDDLVEQPLGKCILRAAGKVWFAGDRGAYVHFGLRNPDAPDILAGKPRRIDQRAATRALSALDEAARECGRKKLQGFRPGRDLSMLVNFRGLDGKVLDVDPNYISRDSPYGRCIRETYGTATVPLFRELRTKVHHKLRF